MDLGEIGWESVSWMYLVQDRVQWWALMNMVMILKIYTIFTKKINVCSET
jgi:hypothetical protein